jgi:hypothetical protein
MTRPTLSDPTFSYWIALFTTQLPLAYAIFLRSYSLASASAANDQIAGPIARVRFHALDHRMMNDHIVRNLAVSM